jgi:hypothetical protein
MQIRFKWTMWVHLKHLRFKIFLMVSWGPNLVLVYLSNQGYKHWQLLHKCRNPSFGLATKAKGLQGCGPRGRKLGSQDKGIPRLRAKRKPGSHITLLPGVLESVREYEGMNPHTPKATPTLGDGVPMESRNFKERLQGSKPNGFWRSLYHWKALGT